MRLLFNPLTITADGHTIDNDLEGALVFLDAAKKGHFTSDDITVAMQGNNLRTLASTLKRYGNCADSLELAEGEYKDHLINSFIGMDHRQRYLDEVLHDTQEPAFTTNITRFLQASLDRIAQTDPADINARTLAFKDPWESLEYDKGKEAVFKERFNEILDGCPAYFRTLMQADPSMTVICTTGLLVGLAAFGAMGGSTVGQIRLDYRSFATGQKNKAAILLKEVILHYLDSSIGATKEAEFQRAAATLLGNDEKMQAIERLFMKISPEKRRLREYPEDHHHAELFVTYFLIRDHLCEQHKAPPVGWVKKEDKTTDEAIPAAVNEQLAKLFGEEVHGLCMKAEETLKRKAAQVPPPSGTLIT